MNIGKIIIIGLGEIGSAWFKVSSNLKTSIWGIDVKGNKKVDVKSSGKIIMHICIPFIKNFDNIVSSYIKKYKPDLVIINTSCKVGTTRRVYEITKANIVHIPVRGVHPNIHKGIKTFVNAIGPISRKAEELAEAYLKKLGIGYDSFNNPEETEMAKLLDTSYYGWNILFAKQVLELCEEYGLDYKNVYTKFNQTYNEGYKNLKKENVIRPVLIPPQVYNKKIGIKNNKINGHCVRTNLEILKSMQKSNDIKFIDYAIKLDRK